MKKESLYYLVEISKSSSMNIAAEQLFISQPALSMSIKKLENELGVQLLERTSSGVVLTQIGEKIVDIAEDIIKLYGTIDDVVLHEKELELGLIEKNLTLHCTYGINQSVIAFILNQLFDIASGFKLKTHAIDSQNIAQYFENEENEALLMIFCPNQVDLKSLPHHIAYQEIVTSKMHILASNTHALAQNRVKSLTLKQATKYPLIRYKASRTPMSEIFKQLEPYAPLNIAAETFDSRFFINMIESGKVIGFAPKSMFRFIQQHEPIVWIPLQETIRVTCALFYTTNFDPEMLTKLISLFKKTSIKL